MTLGEAFSEKLTHLMAATAICCANVASVAPELVTPEMGGHALVEALLGGTALAFLLARRRGDGFVSVLRRCAGEIDRGSDRWFEDEFRGLPDAAAKRDAAVAAIRDALPLIVPTAEELVAARLSEARIADFYLDRAARARPFDFAAKPGNNDLEDAARRDMARRLLAAVVVKTYGVIARQPEFAPEILLHSLAELLQGQDALREDTHALRGDTAEAFAGDGPHRGFAGAANRRAGALSRTRSS